ncbi:MAG: hypothetical protein DMF84_19195 [Acidobacteria bacterium]|nr:MAG: hypothetical protein DMF84_19195 [Acidobacteriota bacterium]
MYRVDLHNDKKNRNTADWFSWELQSASNGGTSVANGLRRIRPSKDGRFVFVHTTTSVIRIDTQPQNCRPIASTLIIAGVTPTVECPRTTWPHDQIPQDPDHPANPDTGSDVTIDGNNNIFSAVAVALPDPINPGGLILAPERSFIQRLNTNAPSNNLTRFYVGGSAGFCGAAQTTTPCLSGVDVDRSGRFVYFSLPEGGENGQGAIGQIDTQACSGLSGSCTIKVWTFFKLTAAGPAQSTEPAPAEPRHLQIDDDGKIWVVTATGHLVSLDPKTNRMTKHFIPPTLEGARDLFAVSPDSSLIGYTNGEPTENKVGLLKPNRNIVPVPPDTPTIFFNTFTANFASDFANRTNGQASPCAKVADGMRQTTNDGTFVDVNIATGMPAKNNVCSPNQTVPSSQPLGLTADHSTRAGTFFYAVGDPGDAAFNRIGRVKMPRANLRARIERDDDDFDDDGKRADVDDDVDDDGIPNALDADNDNDGIPDVSDDDNDNDGIENSFDTPDKKETKQTSQQDVASGAYAQDLFTVNPGTLLVVASATSTDVLASLVVELVNNAGQVVASSLPTPGTAAVTFTPPSSGGTYTLRVKNPSAGLSTISTKILTRELWPLPIVGGVL